MKNDVPFHLISECFHYTKFENRLYIKGLGIGTCQSVCFHFRLLFLMNFRLAEDVSTCRYDEEA